MKVSNKAGLKIILCLNKLDLFQLKRKYVPVRSCPEFRDFHPLWFPEVLYLSGGVRGAKYIRIHH